MGTLHREMWLSEGSGRSRKERASGAYEYFLPTELACMEIALDPDVVGDLTRAEAAIQQLNCKAVALHNTEGLARLLLRAEAVSSSYIEGLSIGTKRLLKAEMNAARKASFKFDEGTAEVVGNIHAMEHAINAAASAELIDVNTILSIHKALCDNTKIERFGGQVRTMQNWVGGNSYNPLQADYIPPAPKHIMSLLEDLAAYCNDKTISPVLQAALAHAQFESIHPFVDGNGRTGRALIHLILKRRGLAIGFVPPVSLCMATHATDYVSGLSEFRYLDNESPKEVCTHINNWVSFFAGCCTRACEEACGFEENAKSLQGEWKELLGGVRKGSALEVLMDEIIGMPVFTVGAVCESSGRAFSAVCAAVERCIEVGIVKPLGSQKRNRVFEVPSVINEFNLFERKLSSPVGDTSVAKPVRPVPANLSK